MRKAAKCLAAISVFVFIIAWGVMGVKMFDGDYLVTAEAYIGMISIIIFFVCIFYLKLSDRCPHCGKTKIPFGKYCPYCGKEIKE
ncbi:MAG: hypothetical protein J6D00_06725 [Christensenellaceae bacterium]|nr:hypothetical protein [Christensenellaceae bacterium]